MRKLLLQLDSSPAPSVFDRIVALDAGADEVMSYGGVTPEAVRDLVHGCIFTRAPKELHHTAIFIGGADLAEGEALLAAVQRAFFGPMRVSVMLDSNGSNTTAVAAVSKLRHVVGEVRGKQAVVLAGAGPVGRRAAGLLAKAGANVVITSRRPEGVAVADQIQQRFGGSIRAVLVQDQAQLAPLLEGAELLLATGPPGTRIAPHDVWRARRGLRAAVDLNAVPPAGIEGIEPTDNGSEKDGVTVFGALGVGSLKMKLHRTCIARLFDQNDLVIDAETIPGMLHDRE